LFARIIEKARADDQEWSNCSQAGTFGTESAVRKRGGSRILSYTLTLDVPRRTDYTRAYEKID
ncbi:hypothetical protein, partial [Clostridium sp.]|uniref:hypothetical protein n=1 Tax=Clostridium sp. TaxID=1506 RepID=UPI0030798895